MFNFRAINVKPGSSSLRKRMLKLALVPLLVAFPTILFVLLAVGGPRFDARLNSIAYSNLATAHNYLDQQRTLTEKFIEQQVLSTQLQQQLVTKQLPEILSGQLRSLAVGVRLDFLVIADGFGRVIASSTGIAPGNELPASLVLYQAITGVPASGFERFDQAQLASISPSLAARAIVGDVRVPGAETFMPSESRGLVITAAVHFPLSNSYPDAILYGGVLLNNNQFLIDRLRDVVFPINFFEEPVNGIATLAIDDVRVSTTLSNKAGQPFVGTLLPLENVAAVIEHEGHWVMSENVLGEWYICAYEEIVGSDGGRLGMMAAGIPRSPYRNEKWMIFGSVAFLLALSMLGVTIIFQRGTQSIVVRLAEIMATIKNVQAGDRGARVETAADDDEIAILGSHFNELLDTLQVREDAEARAQQSIADEAARRRALFEHVRDGLVVFNEDGSVYETNPSFSSKIGYHPDEILHLHCWDWDTQFNRTTDQNFSDMLSQRGDFYETLYRRKNGSSYAAEVSMSRVEWGHKIFYMAVVRNISERKKLEQQLLQARKLEAIGQLAAGVAHEINTPLQYIENNVTFLQKSILGLRPLFNDIQQIRQNSEETDLLRWRQLINSHAMDCDLDFHLEEMPASLQESVEGIQHIVGIVSALKEFSHPGNGNQGLGDLNDLVKNAVVVSRHEWKYVAELETDLDTELPMMVNNPGAWSQVLLNLIVNSAHAIEEQKCSSDPLGKIIVTTHQTENGINLMVSDTGIGISKENKDRIFDPFFTTKDVGKGTGQGLAITYDLIVRKHNGSILCESEPGQGTCFSIFVPQAGKKITE